MKTASHRIEFGRLGLFLAILALCAGGYSPASFAQGEEEFTAEFRIDECTFSSTGRNPFFILEPGVVLNYEGESDGETVTLEITVLDQTREVDGVLTRVLQEREWADGELVEISRNYYAVCTNTNSVFYFGEEVDIYEEGEIVSHEGAWLAGENGALAGIIMPGTILLGSRYFQEIAADDEALDRAEHTAMDVTLETPAGTFENCLEVVETTPLDPEEESIKVYAPGVGLIFDDDLLLTSYTIPEPKAPRSLYLLDGYGQVSVRQ